VQSAILHVSHAWVLLLLSAWYATRATTTMVLIASHVQSIAEPARVVYQQITHHVHQVIFSMTMALVEVCQGSVARQHLNQLIFFA
jgi:hypothetical protein